MKDLLAEGVDFHELHGPEATDQAFSGVAEAPDTAEQVQESENHQ